MSVEGLKGMKWIFLLWNKINVLITAGFPNTSPADIVINQLNLDFIDMTVWELSLVGECRLNAAISYIISLGDFLVLFFNAKMFFPLVYWCRWLSVHLIVCTHETAPIVYNLFFAMVQVCYGLVKLKLINETLSVSDGLQFFEWTFFNIFKLYRWLSTFKVILVVLVGILWLGLTIHCSR